MTVETETFTNNLGQFIKKACSKLSITSSTEHQNESSEVKFVTIVSKHEKLGPDFLKSNNGKNIKETLISKRLLLALQNGRLVFGMQSFEYISYYEDSDHSPLVTVYISRIDTTGLFEPRKHQRDFITIVITAYLDLMKQSCYGALKVHILARANPSYLFPESEELNEKKGFSKNNSNRKLVYWWKHLIDKSDLFEKKSWCIPGFDETMIPRDERSDAWEYGYLRLEGDVNALDCVPMFPDDPKSAQLDLIKDNGKVSLKSLINDYLPSNHDCANCDLGLLVLYSEPKEFDSSFEKLVTTTEVNEDLYDTLEKHLNIAGAHETVPDDEGEDSDGDSGEDEELGEENESDIEVWTFETIESVERSTGMLLELLSVFKHDAALNFSFDFKLLDEGASIIAIKQEQLKPVVNVLSVKRRKVA
ncbi:hypothetical protein MP638_001244 [Amoeboaphelidium occidentale]|nr:hypothetical protein MP638_001244 [Amoeboaphelidium occidentale]